MVKHGVLLATFPAQGHINPAMEFAKRLTANNIHVTFFTSVYARRRMAGTPVDGITFVSFSDGYDDGQKPGDDGKQYMAEMKARGITALREHLDRGGPKPTYIVYSHLFAWAAEVAREAHVPSALLWIEPATVLDIYYFYFNGYGEEIDDAAGSGGGIHLPGLPPLSEADLPSFLLPSTPERFRLMMKEKLETIAGGSEKNKPKVLVNTFDALEPGAIGAVEKYDLIGIGPLIPRAILSKSDGGDNANALSAASYGGDLFHQTDENCLKWLDTHPTSTVVYVSFGSMVRLPAAQLEEIGKGLRDSGRPFLWVIRNIEGPAEEGEVATLKRLEETHKGAGKIVSWCSQLEVLSHPSIGCFVTHCGWNSVLESLSMAVPMVGFPQWFDQGTNAKLMEGIWKIGVRVKTNESGGVDGDEIRRCVERVMDGGEESREVWENAGRWRGLARAAMEENGSSMKNLKAFLDQIGDDAGYAAQ